MRTSPRHRQTVEGLVFGERRTIVERFNGVNRPSLNTLNLIKARSLEVAIPNAGTVAQRQVLTDMAAYAKSVGVDFKIIVVP